MDMIGAVNKRRRTPKKPIRVGNMGTMEVNATSQAFRKEATARVKEMLRKGEPPATDTEVEEAERQGYRPGKTAYDAWQPVKNLGKFAHPPKQK